MVMKTLLILIPLLMTQGIFPEQVLSTIIERYNAVGELQCWGKGIFGLNPAKKLNEFVKKRFNTENRIDLIDKFISDTNSEMFKTLLKRDVMMWRICNPDEFKGLYAALSSKRQALLTEIFYAMNVPEHRKFFPVKENFYGRRFEYKLRGRAVQRKFSEKEWIDAGQEDLKKALEEIRRIEKKRLIIEDSADETAYYFFDLSDNDLREILRLYKTEHFQYVFHNIGYAMFDTFFFNIQQLLLK